MPHQQLVHPQSLETIRAFSKIADQTDDNNLPLHPQSLETINSKKVCNLFVKTISTELLVTRKKKFKILLLFQSLPQNTLKRNRLQLLPHLSCGSEIGHPIAEQSDEQIPTENSERYNLQDSYSPLLTRKDNDDRFLRFAKLFVGFIY